MLPWNEMKAEEPALTDRARKRCKPHRPALPTVIAAISTATNCINRRPFPHSFSPFSQHQRHATHDTRHGSKKKRSNIKKSPQHPQCLVSPDLNHLSSKLIQMHPAPKAALLPTAILSHCTMSSLLAHAYLTVTPPTSRSYCSGYST